MADLAAQQGLTEVSFAVYELLERVSTGATPVAAGPAGRSGQARRVRERGAAYHARLDEHLKGVAVGIEQIMARGQAIVDWQSKEDVQRLMRRDIKRDLRRRGDLGEEQINELAVAMVEIARRKPTR